MKEKQQRNSLSGTVGFCRNCGQEHCLPPGEAYRAALQLMKMLECTGRIDFFQPVHRADPLCSLEYLLGPARGKMFGVLVAQAPNGEQIHLRAFSGQYNGLWQVPGWVEPVFDLPAFHRLHDGEEREIKKLTHQIECLLPDSQEKSKLIRLRKQKSQQLMRRIHTLYQLRNFRGQVAELNIFFNADKGVPTGTGDCCAPKLLQYAALHGLKPLGLTEFYLGRENASGSRQNGCFYTSCRAKCYPILGFMLCGLESGAKKTGNKEGMKQE